MRVVAAIRATGADKGAIQLLISHILLYTVGTITISLLFSLWKVNDMASSAFSGSLAVLVVESNQETAKQMKVSLNQRFGKRMDVLALTSCTEAQRIAQGHRVDFVMANVRSGEGNTFDFCRALRAMAHTAEVPIMLVGEKVSAREKIAGFTSGADDFIVRPIDERLLAARIELLWRIKRMEQLR